VNNIKSSTKLDNIITIVPFIFAFYLGCTYIMGFIFSQMPYIRDFGVLPFQQVHYLYNGFSPVVNTNIFLLCYIYSLINIKFNHKLGPRSHWTAIVLSTLLVCSLILSLKFSIKSLYFDLFTIICFFSLVCYLIYILFYNYSDFNNKNNIESLASMENDIAEMKNRDTNFYAKIFDKIITLEVYASKIKAENIPELQPILDELMQIELDVLGSTNVNESLISRIKILKNAFQEAQQSSQKKLDTTNSKLIDTVEKVKTDNKLTVLYSTLYVFSAVIISLGMLCLISRFDKNYIDKNPEPVYSLVMKSDSNVTIDMPNPKKISVVLITDQYIYGYILSDNNRKPIVINKDVIGIMMLD